MPSPRAERLRRAARWLLPATLLALLPKCLACLAAYAGLGAALGLAGPELCGATDPGPAALAWIGAAAALAVAGGARLYAKLPPRARPSSLRRRLRSAAATRA